MTVPNSSADSFADAVERRGQRQLDDDTEMLVLIVDRLHQLPGSAELSGGAARPDFRAQLRTRLVEEAALEQPTGAKVVPITSRWNQSWGRRNRVRLVSSMAAGIVGLVAVSIAASNSLPGSPFYQLKRGSETVQYAFAGSDEARGKLELGFARTRLHEIDRLTEHNAAYGIEPTEAPQAAGGTAVLATSVATTVVGLFADMDSEAAKGSALLAKSFRDDPRPGPLLAVQQFAKDQAAALTTLSDRLAEPALSKATHSLAWAKQVVTSTTAVLATCSSSTCPQAAVTKLGGSLGASLAPSAAPPSVLAPPSPMPSLVPSVTPSPAPAAPSSSPVPPQPTVTSAPPTSDQPSTLPPTDVPTTPTPTDTPTSTTPTDTPTTSSPTDSPTTTESPSPAPTTPSVPPATTPVDTPPASTTPPQPSATPTVPPTTPDPTTTPPPPTPPASVAPPTTPPPATTTDPPTTVAPTTVAPTTPPTTPPTAAPTTAPTPTRTGRPPLICLPPSFLLNGICVHLPLPPGVGLAST